MYLVYAWLGVICLRHNENNWKGYSAYQKIYSSISRRQNTSIIDMFTISISVPVTLIIAHTNSQYKRNNSELETLNCINRFGQCYYTHTLGSSRCKNISILWNMIHKKGIRLQRWWFIRLWWRVPQGWIMPFQNLVEFQTDCCWLK